MAGHLVCRHTDDAIARLANHNQVREAMSGIDTVTRHITDRPIEVEGLVWCKMISLIGIRLRVLSGIIGIERHHRLGVLKPEIIRRGGVQNRLACARSRLRDDAVAGSPSAKDREPKERIFGNRASDDRTIQIYKGKAVGIAVGRKGKVCLREGRHYVCCRGDHVTGFVHRLNGHRNRDADCTLLVWLGVQAHPKAHRISGKEVAFCENGGRGVLRIR